MEIEPQPKVNQYLYIWDISAELLLRIVFFIIATNSRIVVQGQERIQISICLVVEKQFRACFVRQETETKINFGKTNYSKTK